MANCFCLYLFSPPFSSQLHHILEEVDLYLKTHVYNSRITANVEDLPAETRATLGALLKYFQINPDGSTAKLTLRDWWLYGTQVNID